MSAHVVLCTAPDSTQAAELARALVQERLAACVNLLPGLRSFYWWQGQVQDEPERLLIIKTSTERLDALLRRIAELHPYTVPEGIALDVSRGLEPYLRWLDEQTRPQGQTKV